MEKQIILFRDLGLMDYRKAWEYQEKLLNENVRRKSLLYSQASVEGLLPTQHYLLLTEHPPVYTLGKNGNLRNLLIDDNTRMAKGIGLFHTNRGGDITFHGPGQIVGYPILDLEKYDTDIGKYLRNIEEVIILTLREYGIAAGRSRGETGVWIDPHSKGKERKICAIGVRTSRWITMHGFALNVSTDLSYFNYIVPCGIRGKQVTSMEKELGRQININEVKKVLCRKFEKVFEAILQSEIFF